MARLNLHTKKLNLKGIKTQRLVNISGEDLASLSTAKLEKIASRLISVANKRAKRLEESKYKEQSGAYFRYIEGSEGAKGKFEKPIKTIASREGVKTPKSKSLYRNELLEEANRAKNFLQAKTSTIRGTIKNFLHGEEKLKKAFGTEYYNKETKSWEKRDIFIGNLDERMAKQKKYWDAYYKSIEKMGQFYHIEGSPRFRNMLSRYMESHSYMSDDEILQGFEKELRKRYERKQAREEEKGSIFS